MVLFLVVVVADVDCFCAVIFIFVDSVVLFVCFVCFGVVFWGCFLVYFVVVANVDGF